MNPLTITPMQAVIELGMAARVLRRAGEFDAAVAFQEACNAVRADARCGEELPGPRLLMTRGMLEREGHWSRVRWLPTPGRGYRTPYLLGSPELAEAEAARLSKERR